MNVKYNMGVNKFSPLRIDRESVDVDEPRGRRASGGREAANAVRARLDDRAIPVGL